MKRKVAAKAVATNSKAQVNIAAGSKNRRRRKKGITRAQAIEKNQLVTPINEIVLAQGALKEINIAVQIDAVSFYFLSVAQISMGLVRGQKDPFAAYEAYFSDLQSIATGGVGTAISRLNYFNEILNCLTPKNIPFRNGSIFYSWQNVPGNPGPVLTVPDGFSYYMYVPSSATSGVWATQVTPPSYSPVQVTNTYNDYIQSLGGSKKHNAVVRSVPLGTSYARDGSAFARVSPYWGTGAGVGSPYASNELEVPFLSNLLSTLVSFAPQQPRASRFLSFTTGDSCSNYGIGALDAWNLSYYKGAVAPIYKFIDLAEIMHTVIQSLLEAIQKFLTANPEIDSDTIAELTGGLGCTWSQFFIMLRQQVLWMFADSQCLSQFLTPQTGRGAFIPFICGSNCFPKAIDVPLNIASVLNENLKCLKMWIRPYETKQFNNPKNHITHIPVVGTWATTTPMNYFIIWNDTLYPMFLDESTDTFVPNYFDGTGVSNAVVDFNATTLLQEIASTYNSLVNTTINMWSGVSPIGGDSNGSPFLQYTRYVQFNTENIVEIHNTRVFPRHLKQFIVEKEVETKLVRTTSQSKTEISKKKVPYYAPPDSTVFTMNTKAISSTIPISATMKQNFGNFILPVIELAELPSMALPSQVQVQTGTLEPFLFDGFTENPFNSRGLEIINGMVNMVTGVAGRDSELAAFIKNLAANNQGAFLGDLFAAAGQFIPELRPVTTIASGLANAFGV